MINHIESGFRDTTHDIIRNQNLDEEQANLYEQQIEELLKNPTFLRVLTEKKKKEADKEGNSE